MKLVRPPKRKGPSTSSSCVGDSNQVYEVDTLLDARSAYHGETGVRCQYYLVQWKGFEEQSWEPEENIDASLIAEYYANKKTPKKTRRAAAKVAKKGMHKCVQEDSDVSTSSEEEAFKCKVAGCERKYKTPQGLRQHKKKAHPPTVGVDVENPGLEDQSDDDQGIPIPAVPEVEGQVWATVAQTSFEESCPSDVVEEETSSGEVPSTTVMEVDQEKEVNLAPVFTSEERQTFVPQSSGCIIVESENGESLVEEIAGHSSMASGQDAENMMPDADGPSQAKKKKTYKIVDNSKRLYENWKRAENAYINSLQESIKITQDMLAAEAELRCLEYMKYRKAQGELEKKNVEMGQLVVENQVLLRANLELIEEKEKLRLKKQHLIETTEQLTQENQQLSLEKQQLMEMIKQLREDKEQLTLEKKELMESTALINQEKQQLMQNTEQLRLENQHLMERTDQISLEKRQLMQRMEQLNQEKQQLTLDNGNLCLELQRYREILVPVANKILKLN